MMFAFTYVYIPDHADYHDAGSAAVIAIILYTLVFLSYWCFIKTVFTNPGGTPDGYDHPMKDSDESRVGGDPDMTNQNADPSRSGRTDDETYKRILSNFMNNSLHVDPRRYYDGRVVSHDTSNDHEAPNNEFNNEELKGEVAPEGHDMQNQKSKDAKLGTDIVISCFKYRY